MTQVVIHEEHLGNGKFGVVEMMVTQEAFDLGFTIHDVAEKSTPAPEWIFSIPQGSEPFMPKKTGYDGKEEIDFSKLKLDVNHEFILQSLIDPLTGSEIENFVIDGDGEKIRAVNVYWHEYGYKIVDKSTLPDALFFDAWTVDPALLTDGKGSNSDDFSPQAWARVNAEIEAQRKAAEAQAAAQAQAERQALLAEAVEIVKQQQGG